MNAIYKRGGQLFFKDISESMALQGSSLEKNFSIKVASFRPQESTKNRSFIEFEFNLTFYHPCGRGILHRSFKRFSQIRSFHERMASKLAAMPSFPSRTLLTSKNPAFLEKRRRRIEKYVQFLSQTPLHIDLLHFLGVYNVVSWQYCFCDDENNLFVSTEDDSIPNSSQTHANKHQDGRSPKPQKADLGPAMNMVGVIENKPERFDSRNKESDKVCSHQQRIKLSPSCNRDFGPMSSSPTTGLDADAIPHSKVSNETKVTEGLWIDVVKEYKAETSDCLSLKKGDTVKLFTSAVNDQCWDSADSTKSSFSSTYQPRNLATLWVFGETKTGKRGFFPDYCLNVQPELMK